jgi:hypothetical protein
MAEEKELLADFLRELRQAFEKPDTFALRELGNKAIEEAALRNSKAIASIALVAYCLHKLHSKQHIARHKKWFSLSREIGLFLGKAADALQKDDLAAFEQNMQKVISGVQSIDLQLGNYVESIFEKARVKYASTAYSLGLGLGQSCDLTGASKKELLRYIGSTRMADREAVTFGIKERLQRLRKRMQAE